MSKWFGWVRKWFLDAPVSAARSDSTPLAKASLKDAWTFRKEDKELHSRYADLQSLFHSRGFSSYIPYANLIVG
jgi:hypothetical protein